MVSKKSLAIGLILGLIIGLPTGYFLQQVILSMNSQPENQITNGQNPIFCNAYESGTSSWQKEMGYPVLSRYDAGAKNSSILPNVNLQVSISNNNSISLFNVQVDVTYRTTENEWNTTEKVNIGFLDIQQSKKTKITLMNPYLLVWETKRRDYSAEGLWENVTVYVLNATDLKIAAYGFAKP